MKIFSQTVNLTGNLSSFNNFHTFCIPCFPVQTHDATVDSSSLSDISKCPFYLVFPSTCGNDYTILLDFRFLHL